MNRLGLPEVIQHITPDQAPWHLLTGLITLVVAVYIAVSPSKAALWWLPMGLFTVWVVVGFFLPPRLTGSHKRRVGIAYFLTGTILFFFVLRVNAVAYALLFVMYPTAFNRLELPVAILIALLVGATSVASEYLKPDFSWGSPAVLMGGVFGSIGAILLGIFIERLTTINQERSQLIAELQSTQDELAQAEREAGVLEERQRLAREIHDTLAQGFTSITMHLEAAEGALGEVVLPQVVQGHVNLARQTARDSLTEARRMVRALRPDLLENASSVDEAIRRHARRWASSTGVPVHLTVTGEQMPLTVEQETALLRSAQEALHNAHKHASAIQVAITLSYMGDQIALDIYDDGQGFDPDRAVPGDDGGFGLRGMQERIEALGGEFSIETEPGEGTTIALSLPVAASEEEQNDTPVSRR